MIEFLVRLFRAETIAGRVTFFDGKDGVIKSGDVDYWFHHSVVTRGSPAEGMYVMFQSWETGKAHNVCTEPTAWERVFPPSPDILDTQYFYSPKSCASESALSRSAFLRTLLSKS